MWRRPTKVCCPLMMTAQPIVNPRPVNICIIYLLISFIIRFHKKIIPACLRFCAYITKSPNHHHFQLSPQLDALSLLPSFVTHCLCNCICICLCNCLCNCICICLIKKLSGVSVLVGGWLVYGCPPRYSELPLKEGEGG